ncbi:MAG: SH3 domain-containing protein [Methylophilaceae bacterium]
MTINFKKSALVLFAFLIPCISIGAEMGTALKADTLRKEPYADAKTSGSFARGDKVEVITKQGAWLKVKAAKSTGWVRLLSVKRGSTATANQTAGILSVASGRAGTGQVVATTGVRGLTEEELKDAKFNEAEVKSLESYTQSTAQGQKFAKAGNLKAIKLEYLPNTGGSAQ